MYHATYQPHLASILEWGLGGAPAAPPRNYPDSRPGVVYLATSADLARSYAETSDEVPDEWLDAIVVLAVDTAQLDPKALAPDSNVRRSVNETPETFEYQGVIPPQALRLVPDF